MDAQLASAQVANDRVLRGVNHVIHVTQRVIEFHLERTVLLVYPVRHDVSGFKAHLGCP